VSFLTTVERFDASKHDVSQFTCGNTSLDDYIHQTVTRDEAQRTAVTYVLLEASEPSVQRRILGYFTLNSYTLARSQARRRDRDKHLGPYDPVPAVLIGRLALDSAYQRQGLGSVLLTSALMQVLTIRQSLGVAVVVVHAIDDAAASFYEHYGFTRFRDEPSHLYYPLATFEMAILAGEDA
jgi:GNAT superfamily N-acetyltransferase